LLKNQQFPDVREMKKTVKNQIKKAKTKINSLIKTAKIAKPIIV
jgi:hypothetical protein